MPEDGSQQLSQQHPGLLLRPLMARGGGIDSRFGGLRRHNNHSTRPLSDPGVAMHLPPYPPPPFPEAFLNVAAYPDAFPGYLWGPPPPYSQPTSTENIPSVTAMANSPTSPNNNSAEATSPVHRHDGTPIIISPAHRPPTLADLIRGSAGNTPVRSINSPNEGSEIISSPVHLLSRPPRARHKGSNENMVSNGTVNIVDSNFDGTNSLPLRHKRKRIPIGHVKSSGDVTEDKNDESLEVLFCDGKELVPLDKLHKELIESKVNAEHLKTISDSKSTYGVGKVEPESEIYFADVSSCVSQRPEGEVMYYSDPTSSGSQQYSQQQVYQDPSQHYVQNLSSSISSSHMYEQVREEEEGEENESHHTSDDTMIVHTSSSEHSMAGDTDAVDTENTYSIISPATDFSSPSPMVTDTDTYSCYAPVIANTSAVNNCQNKNSASSVQATFMPESIQKQQSAPTHIPQELSQVSSKSDGTVNSNVNNNSSSKSATPLLNINLHHPLHPIHHHQHQAYRHQLSHNHGHDASEKAGKLKDNINNNSKNTPLKKDSKSSKQDDQGYEEVQVLENPNVKETVPDSMLNRVSPVKTAISRNTKFDKSKKFSKLSSNQLSLSNMLSQSPSKHKHRQHAHHKHPHQFYHHHHNHPRIHNSQDRISSSSTSSSLSSPSSPSAQLPQDSLSDLNGNHPSSPSSATSPIPLSKLAKHSQVESPSNSHCVENTASRDGSSSNANNSSTCNIFSSKPVDNASIPVLEAKHKLVVPNNSQSSSVTKKQRPNLSLPLKKLIASDIEKNKGNPSSSPQKPSLRNGSSQELSAKIGKEKKVSDREKTTTRSNSAKPESKKRSSKEHSGRTPDNKHSTRKALKSESESKNMKKSRKSKAVTNDYGFECEGDLTVAAGYNSPQKSNSENNSPVKSCDQSEQPERKVDAKEKNTNNVSSVAENSRRTNNVQHLLQNLKSVNV